jgi:tRNA(Ile)-lysidine synthase TilS/MesJ
MMSNHAFRKPEQTRQSVLTYRLFVAVALLTGFLLLALAHHFA